MSKSNNTPCQRCHLLRRQCVRARPYGSCEGCRTAKKGCHPSITISTLATRPLTASNASSSASHVPRDLKRSLPGSQVPASNGSDARKRSRVDDSGDVVHVRIGKVLPASTCPASPTSDALARNTRPVAVKPSIEASPPPRLKESTSPRAVVPPENPNERASRVCQPSQVNFRKFDVPKFHKPQVETMIPTEDVRRHGEILYEEQFIDILDRLPASITWRTACAQRFHAMVKKLIGSGVPVLRAACFESTVFPPKKLLGRAPLGDQSLRVNFKKFVAPKFHEPLVEKMIPIDDVQRDGALLYEQFLDILRRLPASTTWRTERARDFHTMVARLVSGGVQVVRASGFEREPSAES